MKIIKTSIFLLLSVVLFTACKRESVVPSPSETTEGLANLKVIYAMPYVVDVPVQVKVNDKAVSNLITCTTPFPGGGLNTGGGSYDHYIGVQPGAVKVSIAVPQKGTAVDSLPFFNGTVTLEANKYYSLFVTDTAANAKQYLVTENVQRPVDPLTTRYKFVNVMPNQPALDLYFDAIKVASNVPYLGTSADFIVPRDSAVKLTIRPAGAPFTDAPIYTYPTATSSKYSVPKNRVMTIYANGYSGATGNRLGVISLFYN